MNIFLFLGITFFIIFILGILLEKIKAPWIFAALILGLVLSPVHSLASITGSSVFEFLANLGMYFLLFLIGLELDFQKIKKLGAFIVRAVFFIVLFEALFGSLLIHFVFHYSWLVSIIVAVSFATVGEALLIPILDEYQLVKTKLGQSILGIGTLDDVIEVLIMIVVVLLFPYLGQDSSLFFSPHRIFFMIAGLAAMMLLSLGLVKIKEKTHILRHFDIDIIFFLSLAIFFIFLGIAAMEEETLLALGAILAGITIRNFIPNLRIKAMEKEIKTLAFAFFGPIFFLWVGIDTDLKYLFSSFFLIVILISVTFGAKILASYIIGKKRLGTKKSVFMGVALGVRFSTSIVIIKILFEGGIINSELYSVLVGSTIAFNFIVPFLLSYLVNRWKIASPSVGSE